MSSFYLPIFNCGCFNIETCLFEDSENFWWSYPDHKSLINIEIPSSRRPVCLRILKIFGIGSRTSISPKSFRYLNFGITSFSFKFFGINKNYLLIIKKFITRFNYNFWLLNHWLFITLNRTKWCLLFSYKKL